MGVTGAGMARDKIVYAFRLQQKFVNIIYAAFIGQSCRVRLRNFLTEKQ